MTHYFGNAILVSFVVLQIAGSSDILGHSQLLENAKFQELPGALPLDPTRALPWTQWGLTVPPGAQLELAMIVGHCISCLRYDSPTPPTISH